MGFDFRNFGARVFSDKVMQQRLPAEVYASLKRSTDEGLPLDPAIADAVAAAMKDWALEQGATHFTHWFQPMTNITAGKHDSFLSMDRSGEMLLNFRGKELIKGEPDASSFPNGGLRNTFEARGYTAWDCTSPAFVRDGTLYIPTAFCAYNGEALDTKTPLLRSMSVISAQALRLIRLFGNTTAKRVDATVGAEQEYFLINRTLYEQRLDLKICGRTLFGARPPKGQELDDHYCGRIRLKVADYMKTLDAALWELGVPAKTKHNEAAPAQHELAPIFDTVNVACDHNQLTMELMRIIAKKKGLACLLHEKPFANVNGSGKHNNWSLCTDDGVNLLSPSHSPYENMQFLLLLSAILAAVDEHADLLRMSAAAAGNDHRLGGNEAPPAIISVFLGEQLTSVLEQAAAGICPPHTHRATLLSDIPALPTIKKDESDRNRTSPFAFTGNKFEFRMVGSSASIACANYVLNTIVAESLDRICTRLEQAEDFDREVYAIIADTYREHGRIIYNGNNYTAEWVALAKERGLVNLQNTVDAAAAITAPHNVSLLSRFNVLTPAECEARYEIMLENYCQILNIEAHTMLEMTRRELLPAVSRFAGETARDALSLKEAGFENAALFGLAHDLSDDVTAITAAVSALQQTMDEATHLCIKERAAYCRDAVRPRMDALRRAVDEAEVRVARDKWPMPTYTDLLYRV